MKPEYIHGMKEAVAVICKASCSQEIPCEAPCFSVTALLLAGGPELLASLGLPSEVDYHPTFTTRLEKLVRFRRDRDRLCSLIEDLTSWREAPGRNSTRPLFLLPTANGLKQSPRRKKSLERASE